MEKTLLLWIEIVLASERTANRTGKENCSVFVPRVFSSASRVLRCLARLPRMPRLPRWLAHCASPYWYTRPASWIWAWLQLPYYLSGRVTSLCIRSILLHNDTALRTSSGDCCVTTNANIGFLTSNHKTIAVTSYLRHVTPLANYDRMLQNLMFYGGV